MNTDVTAITGLLATGGGGALIVGALGGIAELEGGTVHTYQTTQGRSLVELVALPDSSCSVVEQEGDPVFDLFYGVRMVTAAGSLGESDLAVAALVRTGRGKWHPEYESLGIAQDWSPTLERVSDMGRETLWAAGPRIDDACVSGGLAYYITANKELWSTQGGPASPITPAPSGSMPRLACTADGLYAVSRGELALGPVEYIVENFDGVHWSELGRFDLADTIDDVAVVNGVVYAVGAGGNVVRFDTMGSAVVHTSDALRDCVRHPGLLTVASASDIYALSCDELVHFDGMAWTTLAPSGSILGCPASALDVDASGRLVLACGYSLARFDGEGLQPLARFSEDQLAVALDARGGDGILVGTHTGEVLEISDAGIVPVANNIAGPVLWMQRDQESTWFASARGGVGWIESGAAAFAVSSPPCDRITSVLPTGGETAIALCQNGDLLDVTASGVASRAGSVPWPIGAAPDGMDGRLEYSKLSGTADDLFVMGAVWPSSGKEPSLGLGLLYHFDGTAWRQLDGLGMRVPLLAVGAGPDDIFVVVSNVEYPYFATTEALHWDGTGWQTHFVLDDSGTPGSSPAVLASLLGDASFLVDVEGAPLYSEDGASWASLATNIGPARYAGTSLASLCAASSNGAVWTGSCGQ